MTIFGPYTSAIIGLCRIRAFLGRGPRTLQDSRLQNHTLCITLLFQETLDSKVEECKAVAKKASIFISAISPISPF